MVEELEVELLGLEEVEYGRRGSTILQDKVHMLKVELRDQLGRPLSHLIRDSVEEVIGIDGPALNGRGLSENFHLSLRLELSLEVILGFHVRPGSLCEQMQMVDEVFRSEDPSV